MNFREYLLVGDLIETTYAFRKGSVTVQLLPHPTVKGEIMCQIGQSTIYSVCNWLEDDEKFRNCLVAIYRKNKGDYKRIWKKYE